MRAESSNTMHMNGCECDGGPYFDLIKNDMAAIGKDDWLFVSTMASCPRLVYMRGEREITRAHLVLLFTLPYIIEIFIYLPNPVVYNKVYTCASVQNK